MNMHHALSFYIRYLPTIIEIISILILLISAYVIVIVLKDRKKDSSGLDQIEESLKKILKATESKTTSNSTTSTSNQQILGTSVDPTILQQTQVEITQKDNKIKELELEIKKQNEILSKDQGGPSKQELEKKIKEIEGKLADYEIIEDDIADLSLYKEENEKLKNEIESLKKSAQTAPPISSQSAAQPEQKIPEPNVASKAPNLPPDDEISNDLMAEFAKAVEDQKSGKLENETTPSPPAPPAPPVAEKKSEQKIESHPSTQSSAQEKPKESSPIKTVDTHNQLSINAAPKEQIENDILAEFFDAGVSESIQIEPLSPTNESPQLKNEQKNENDKSTSEADSDNIPDSIIDDFKNLIDEKTKNESKIKKRIRNKASELSAQESNALNFELNTQKMLEEASSLQTTNEETSNSLEEDLNTDKMLSEVDDLNKLVNDENKN